MKNQQGKFIVIDGTDGSGKATQTELLAQRLKRAGFDVAIADFPQYNTKSAGLVEEYLSGKYGGPEAVGPYCASIFYACDRYDASFKIRDWLKQGKIVISNRYVTANMGHQGGKIDNSLGRKHFLNWLYQLEYEIFNIPRPDLNIILHVPAEISQSLALQRHKLDWVGKTNDIHQEDLNHLKKAELAYLEIAKSFPDFALIECVAYGQILSREEISDLVWQKIVKLFKPTVYSTNFKELHDKIQPTSPKTTGLKLKVEKISPWAKLPTRAYKHDAGLDLYSSDYYTIMPGERVRISNGIRLEIPAGYVGLVWDKSGISTKNGIHCIAGVIDSGYRGEMAVNVVNLSQDIYNIAPGQKIAQLLIQKIEMFDVAEAEVDKQTERGETGYGASGLF